MIALLIVLLVLFLIGCIPLGVKARYNENGPFVWILIGPFSMTLIPKKDKPKKEKKPKQKKKVNKGEQKSHESVPEKERKNSGVGGTIALFRELLPLGLDALGHIRRTITIKDFSLHLMVGGKGDTPDKAAVLYGSAWAAIGNLIPLLENNFQIKKRDLQAEIDFTQEENRIFAEAALTLTVGEILWIGLYYGLKALNVFLKNRKKGGKKHGTSD